MICQSCSCGRRAMSRVALATSIPTNKGEDVMCFAPARPPNLARYGLRWPRQLYGLCQARTCRPKLTYGLVKPTLGVSAWHVRNTYLRETTLSPAIPGWRLSRLISMAYILAFVMKMLYFSIT